MLPEDKDWDERWNEIWDLYFERLVRLCEGKLANHHLPAADGEDAVLSAFKSLCRRLQEGKPIRDPDNIWSLLETIAKRKVSDYIKHERRKKRGGGWVRKEKEIEQVIGSEPTPEMANIMIEECERLMELLGDETLQKIAQLKAEGHTIEEIAEKLGWAPRTIFRKLKLIREIWSEESPDDE